MITHAIHKKTGKIAITKEECEGTPFWLKKELEKEQDDNWECTTIGNHMTCVQNKGPVDNPDVFKAAKATGKPCPCKATKSATQADNPAEQLTQLAKQIAQDEGVSLSTAYDRVGAKNSAMYKTYTEGVKGTETETAPAIEKEESTPNDQSPQTSEGEQRQHDGSVALGALEILARDIAQAEHVTPEKAIDLACKRYPNLYNDYTVRNLK